MTGSNSFFVLPAKVLFVMTAQRFHSVVSHFLALSLKLILSEYFKTLGCFASSHTFLLVWHSFSLSDKEGKQVFVGGLPDSVNENVLRAYFSQYGTISDVHVIPPQLWFRFCYKLNLHFSSRYSQTKSQGVLEALDLLHSKINHLWA